MDMIGVKNLEQRAKEIDALGVDYICVHTGYDLQAEGQSPFEALQTVKKSREKLQNSGCWRH